GSTRGFHIRPLFARPVLNVSDREERLVLKYLCAVSGGVDPTEITYVVAIFLQELHHRKFCAEKPAFGLVRPRIERPVIADLVRPTGRGANRRSVPDIEAIAAVSVVPLPCLVRGFDENVRATAVVTNYERNMAR